MEVSKGFIKRTMTFFIMMDTLASIYKEITNLVYKQHFLDILFFKIGYQYRWSKERHFDNYRDVDIPKKIKFTIVENLVVDIKYPGKRLDPFLAKVPIPRELQAQDVQRLRITTAPKTTFEMIFRANKTYYI